MDTLQLGLGDGGTGSSGAPLVALQGAGVTAPVRGALMRECRRLEGGLAEETIDLALEGSPAAIEDCLRGIGRLLAEAEAQAGLAGGAYRYLEARVMPGGTLLRSKLVGGQVELLDGAGARAFGRGGARLRLTRQDYWEGPLTWLPLNNGGGEGVTGGLTVYNHRGASAAQDNRAWINPQDALGELPAPALLEWVGLDTTATGTLYAGQAVNLAAGLSSIEGEEGAAGSGVTGTPTANAGASKGSYLRLAWSGASEVTAWKKDFSPFDMLGFAGRAFLPVMRLHAPTAEALWFYWRVTVAYGGVGQAAYDAPGGWLATGLHHCAGTALFLPPWPLAEGEFPPGVGLELRVRAAAAGAHLLDLDCLHLLPLDYWRVYRPVFGSYGGLKITDDPYGGTLKSGDWAIQMHQPEGPGLVVVPGAANRYHFLMEKSGGGFTPANRASLRMGCRARYRGL